MFVNDILRISEKHEDIIAQILHLTENIEKAKHQLHEYVQTYYIEFHTHFKACTDVYNQVHSLHQQVNTLNKKIGEEHLPEIKKACNEFQDVTTKLMEANITLQHLKQLVAIEDCLNQSRDTLESGEYIKSALALDQAKENLKGRCEEGESLRMLRALKEEVVLQRERLLYHLGELWKQMWTFHEDDSEVMKTGTLVCNSGLKYDRHNQLLSALYLLGELKFRMGKFAKSFLSSILKPVMCHRTDITILYDDNKSELCVNCHLNSSEISFSVLTSNLIKVFDFVTKLLETDGPESPVLILGQALVPEFREYFVKQCVLPALPESSRDTDQFQEMFSILENFQKHLEKLGILDDKSHLLGAAQDMEAVFSNHLSRRLYTKARCLISSDILEAVSVGHGNKEIEGELESPFCFPKCQISLWSVNLLSLLQQTLDDISKGDSPVRSGRLALAVRYCLEMVVNTAPVFHKETLSTLPQASALFHTSCYYLAHHLTLLPSSEKTGVPPLIDLVPLLRNQGSNALLEQMRRQRQLLQELIKEGFPSVATREVLSYRAEPSLQGCILQLQHLQRLWSETLPKQVFLRAQGTLISSVLEELLSRMTSVEDVAADAAVFLVTVLTSFFKQLPKLMSSPEPSMDILTSLIPVWKKFDAVLSVLDSSLRDIEEQWTKGPLSNDMKPSELKHLVRALFQNTDRRAALLAKIK